MENTSTKLHYSHYFTVLNILLYLFYPFATFFLLGFCRIYIVEDLLTILTSPPILVFFLINLAFSLYFSFLMKKQFINYDASPEAIENINTFSRKITIINILTPTLLNFSFPFFILLSCKLNYIDFIAHSSIFASIGVFFVASTMAYIFWLARVQKALETVPLRKSDLVMDSLMKKVLIIIFAISGSLFILLSVLRPLEMIETFEDLTIKDFYIKKVLPIFIFSFLSAVIDIFISTKNDQKRLHVILNRTEEFSKNKFDMEAILPDSRDEYGLICVNCNSIQESTRTLLQKISNESDASINLAEDVKLVSTKMSEEVSNVVGVLNSVKADVFNQTNEVANTTQTIHNIEQAINNLKTDLESQTSSVVQSSSAIEQMVSNIHSVNNILKQNVISVENLSKAAEEGQSSVNEAVASAESIMKASQFLQQATSIIQNIASRTNLLAMNAAIEASHAGVAGKGFAVVADEIRKLAEQSDNQSKSISSQLEELSKQITNVKDNTMNVQEKFKNIYELADVVKNQEEVIRGAMTEQEAGSSQILEGIQLINNITTHSRDNSQEILQGAKEIMGKMETVSESTEQVHLSMKKIETIIEEINTNANETQDSSIKNKNGILQVKEGISKFQI